MSADTDTEREITASPIPTTKLRPNRGQSGMGFDGFLCHVSRQDGDLARAVREELHRLARRPFQLRALRIFLDQANAAAGPLPTQIRTALAKSRFLIIFVRPELAKRPWCQQEIQDWLADPGRPTPLLALTSGADLAWDHEDRRLGFSDGAKLPAELAEAFSAEPLWVDLRPYSDPLAREGTSWLREIARLALPLHGLDSVDQLLGLDHTEQRRLLRLRNITLGVVAGLALLAVLAAVRAIKARNEAEQLAIRSEAGRLASESRRLMDQFPKRSALLAAKAARLAQTGQAPFPPMVHEALYATLNNLSGELLETDHVKSFSLSADGRWLMALSEPGEATMWELKDRPELLCRRLVPSPKERVTSAAFTPDSQSVLISGTGGSIGLVHLQAGNGCSRPEPLIDLDSPASHAEFSADGSWLLTFESADNRGEGLFRLRRWPESSAQTALSWPGRSISAFEHRHFDPTSRLLVTPEAVSEVLCVRDLRRPEDFQSACRLPLHLSSFITMAIAFAPDGEKLALAGTSKRIEVWDLSTRQIGEPSCTFGPFDKWVYDLSFSRSGQFLYAGIAGEWPNASRQPLLAWDFSGADGCPEPLRSPSEVEGVVRLKPLDDGHAIVASSWDGKILTWDATSNSTSMRDAEATILRQLIPSRRSNLIATAGQGRQIEIWPLDTTRLSDPKRTFRGFDDEIVDLGLSADDRWLVAASDQGELRIWDLQRGLAGQPENVDLTLGEETLSHACDEHGTTCVVSTTGHDLIVWDLTQENALSWRRRPLDLPEAYDLRLSPSGRWLIVQSGNARNVELVDTTNLDSQPQQLLATDGHSIGKVEFDPTESFFLMQDPLGSVVGLWKVNARGVVPVKLSPPAGALDFGSVAFNSDGTLMAIVWDLEESHDLLEVRSNDGEGVPWQRILHQEPSSAPSEVYFGKDGVSLLVASALTSGSSPDEGASVSVRPITKGVAGWTIGSPTYLKVGFGIAAARPQAGWGILTDGANSLALDFSASLPVETPLPVAAGYSQLLFSPDAHWLAARRAESSTASTAIEVFHREGRIWSPVAMADQSTETLREATFSPDSQWLATGGDEGTVRLYRLLPGRSLEPIQVLQQRTWIKELRFDSSSKYVFSLGDDDQFHRAALHIDTLVEELKRRAGR